MNNFMKKFNEMFQIYSLSFILIGLIVNLSLYEKEETIRSTPERTPEIETVSNDLKSKEKEFILDPEIEELLSGRDIFERKLEK